VGLTNEEGAMVKVVSATEIEGLRNVGSFVTTVQKMPIQYILWLSFLNRQIHLEFGKNLQNTKELKRNGWDIMVNASDG
jgi:hypothetical protein